MTKHASLFSLYVIHRESDYTITNVMIETSSNTTKHPIEITGCWFWLKHCYKTYISIFQLRLKFIAKSFKFCFSLLFFFPTLVNLHSFWIFSHDNQTQSVFSVKWTHSTWLAFDLKKTTNATKRFKRIRK